MVSQFGICRIVIVGDICPTVKDMKYFENGQIESLIDEKIYNLLANADFAICNLETVLSCSTKQIAKAGPALSAAPGSVCAIKKMGFHYASLANNHIMDFGRAGAQDTIKTLDLQGIAYSGIGENCFEASRVYYANIKDFCIGIVSCCEHEFSAAEWDSFGAYSFDPLETPDLIAEARGKCDYLIVLYHGGKEFYRYPSPQLKKICMKCVDKGADIVVCQHSHCIGCEQDYKGKKIIYGQGNFIFNRKSDDFWDSGLILTIDLSKSEKPIINHIVINNCEGKKIIPQDTVSNQIESLYKQRSIDIESQNEIDKQYRTFAKESIRKYLRTCSGKSIEALFDRVFNKIFKKTVIKKVYPEDVLLNLENYISCEAHRELFAAGLKELRNNGEKNE